MRKIFITGTDTDIGKTYVSVKLLQEFNQQDLKTIGIKPVATGCINGRNADALLLQQNSSIKLEYSLINPFAFEPPISPNIASSYQIPRMLVIPGKLPSAFPSGMTRETDFSVDKIYKSLQEALNTEADIHLIEGVGGFMTPINEQETMADLVKKFEAIEIILVVGIRLGCLNHALLTYQAIKKANLSITGWIANIVDPNTQAIDENIATLKSYITEPCLRVMQYEYH